MVAIVSRRKEREEVVQLLISILHDLKSQNPTTHKPITPDKPFFREQSSRNNHSHFYLPLNYDNTLLEVFFDTNGYGTKGMPHIGFKAPNIENHQVAYERPVEGQIVDTSYVAYVINGSLQLSRVYYRKGMHPIERSLRYIVEFEGNGSNSEIEKLSSEREKLIQVLLANKDKFLAKNSGIPQDLVNKRIKHIYAKLEEIPLQKQYEIKPKVTAMETVGVR